VTIGDVADEINEKVTNPSLTGRDKFIRPEDLEIGEMYVENYRRPEGVESGWGVNFTHQGDTIFATWFSYFELPPDWLSA